MKPSEVLLLLLGAALAASVVALLMALVFSAQLVLAFFIFAYFFALFVGLPGYLILRSRHRANWLTIASVGLAVGLLVVAAFGFWNSRIIRIEQLYATPWLAAVANSAVFAIMGSIGALAFWLVVRGAQSGVEASRVRLLAAVAAVAISGGLLFLLPQITKDRSCHTEAYGPGPPLFLTSLKLRLTPDEWPALMALLEPFGRQYELSTRSELWRPPQSWDQEFEFSLCRSGETNIYGGLGTDGVYVRFRGSNQQELRGLFRDLYRRIIAQWPDRTTFSWEGEPTTRPDWLDQSS